LDGWMVEWLGDWMAGWLGGWGLRRVPIQLLLWTTGPLTAILVILAVLGVLSHQRAMRGLVEARDARLARTAAGRLSDRLQIRSEELLLLADEVASGGPETLLFHRRLAPPGGAHTGVPFRGGLAIVRQDGDVLATFPIGLNWTLRRAALQALLSSETASSLRVSPVVDDPVTREPILLLAVPAGENWLVGGVTLAELDVRTLVVESAPGARGRAFIVDREGRVLTTSWSDPVVETPLQWPGVAQALRGQAGATVAPVADERWVISYAPVEPVGWALILLEPWGAVVGPLMRFSLVAPLLLVVAIIGAGLTILFGLRAIVHPLQELDQRAVRLAWGDFEAVQKPVGGTQEIEDLRRTLDDLAQQIRAYQQGMRDYIAAITRGQEEERKRLARELHDDTVQDLIALGHRVEMARRALERDPAEAAQRLDELRELINKTVAEVRRFTRALRPIYLEDLGLLPALEMLVRDVASKTGVETTFHLSGSPRRLPEELELTVYRIAQEALRNVEQHAQAHRVDLFLRFMPDEVVLEVVDDGVGFDVPEHPEELAHAGHFGLLGMRERAALVGGRLVLRSTPGQGTQVRVHLPV